MPARNRANPLALAVLICLLERPMHPYEVATTLRQRHMHESVRLNYGSLYAAVESLERRGLIAPRETVRAGRLPERTVYALTAAGQIELHDWLTDLVSAPVKEYPAFESALSFLPALPPDDAVELLKERAQHLETELAQAYATRELVAKQGVPRLFWLDAEFHNVQREAELSYVRKLASDIVSGALDGAQWWREVHERGDEPSWLPPFIQGHADDGPAGSSSATDQPDRVTERGKR